MVVGYPQWMKMVQTACCTGQLVKRLLLSCWIQFCKSTAGHTLHSLSWSSPYTSLHRSQAPTLTPDCSHCSVEAKSPQTHNSSKVLITDSSRVKTFELDSLPSHLFILLFYSSITGFSYLLRSFL